MKNLINLFIYISFSVLITVTLSSCELDDVDPDPGNTEEPPTTEEPGGEEIPNTPFTSIPDELVGTWYTSANENPLTINWKEGTFQGETGFQEFRTMVFAKDGKNAIEYYTETYGSGRGVMFKRIGTLVYTENPRTLAFHVQSGMVRIFKPGIPGYEEIDHIDDEWPAYESKLIDMEVTSYTNSTNYLFAKRSKGVDEYAWSVQYTKVDDDTQNEEIPSPIHLYDTPPATGTFVEIDSKYYPTVTIGNQEWMSVNYAGIGGLYDSKKLHYGTFFKSMDLKDVSIPTGWRLPSKQDYITLLESQGLVLADWGSTDGEDLPSKKRLGQLMATTGWLKEDGYATNTSGFNAVPASTKVLGGDPNGEGTNCYLWTSDVDSNENPIAFEIIQLSSATYASFSSVPIGYYPQHLPLRLVKDK